MQPKQFINLLLITFFSTSYTCFSAQKVSAEIVETALGNIQIACDTNSQKCYTPQNGGWVYFGTIREVSNHQSTARMCRDAWLGERYAAYFTRYTNCGIYGYPKNQRSEDSSRSMEEQLERIRQNLGY